MNRTTIIGMVVFTVVVGIFGPLGAGADLYEETILGHGATHYWRLGETSGTTAINLANPGTNDGMYTGTYVLGQTGALSNSANGAFYVDGAGYVSIGDLGATPTQGTIEFWMCADVVENYRNPLSTSGTTGGNEGYRFEENAAGNFHLRVGNDSGANHTPYTLTNSLEAGQWYHVAATWDATNSNAVKAYLNGVQVVNSSFAYSFASNLANVEIGRGFSTSDARWWKGLVDEVAIYDTVLDSTNVALHYDIGTGTVRDDVISANFASGNSGSVYSMTADMIAGVLPVKNWNNLTGSTNSTGVTLNDATGTATTATITWSCNGTYNTGIDQTLSGDHMMMKGHLDARASTDAIVTVSDIPDNIANGGYDVFVYFDAVTDSGLVNTGYTIGDETYWTQDTSTFDGLYVQALGTTKATATAGSNYAWFRNLTGASFTLVADSDTFRAEISGIQIVGVPEPCTWIMASAGLLFLLAMRRREPTA